MMRWVPCTLLLAVLLTPAVAQEDTFDLSQALGRSFSDVALLPTRLTVYNQHDDAARATYTCCKPWQEEQIAKALKANAAFLMRYPTSDYADDTYMHTARVNSVKKDFRAEVAAYRGVLRTKPHSDLADDAAWGLATLFARDKDHGLAIDALNYVIVNYPESTWADDAHLALAIQFREVDDEASYLDTLNGLVTKYPQADCCAQALNLLAEKYREVENYAAAIDASEDLMRRFPYSDYLDDSQFRIAESLRMMGRPRDALDAYCYLVEELTGSSLTNRAIREANRLSKNLRGAGQGNTALYNAEVFDPGRDAQDLWDTAQHLQNYRSFGPAVARYREFMQRYPGHDSYDNAMYNIGVCYQQMNILFEDINKAEGPEDLYALQGRYEDAVGRRQSIPGNQELSAVADGASAFAMVVNRFTGSLMRDDALYEIAKTYEDSDRNEDMVYTYLQLVAYYPGSSNEMEALYEVLKYMSVAKNYDKAKAMYPVLSNVFPNVFPKGLEQNKKDYLALMGAFFKHVDFGWFEYHKHHIPYRVTVADLVPDAAYTLAALNMQRGNFKHAVKQLRFLVDRPTHDLCAPAHYLTAICYERSGKLGDARKTYETIISQFPDSGLADDARLALTTLGEAPDAACVAAVKDNLDYSPGATDWYNGERIFVFAPYTVSVKMRQYNLPNIWEEAQCLLCDWTGVAPDSRPVIAIDPGCRSRNGNPMLLPGCKISDPPDWSLGFEAMARLSIEDATGNILSGGPYVEGLAKFAASSLQYDLVTETRDAIGSASAVVLPQEDVIRARERALTALGEHVREGSGQPDAEVVAGMLYALLDANGFSETCLIDRQPYAEFFTALSGPFDRKPKAGAVAFSYGLASAMGSNCGEQLRTWGLPAMGQHGG